MPFGDGTGPLGLGPGVGGRGMGPCRYLYGYAPYTPWYYRPFGWFRPFFSLFTPWWGGYGYGWRWRRGWGWRGGWWW